MYLKYFPLYRNLFNLKIELKCPGFKKYFLFFKFYMGQLFFIPFVTIKEAIVIRKRK